MNKIKFNTYFDENCHLTVTNGNSKVGKGIFTVNTLAGDKPLTKKDGTQLTNISGTCTGCCECCKDDCYAIDFQVYRNKNIPSWNRNTILAKEYPDIFFKELQDFIDRNMVAAIRYHASGEIPSYKYLEHMVKIANNNPMIQFYTYTKRYLWIERYLRENETLPSNLTILVSIWNRNYSNPYNLPEFIYDDGTDPDLQKVVRCPATDENGNETGVTCASCKRCLYAKRNTKICVYAHGKKQRNKRKTC